MQQNDEFRFMQGDAERVGRHAALPERLNGLVIVDITPGIRPQRDAGAISDFISGQRDGASPLILDT